MAAQLLPIITKIANGNSVDAVTTENQDEDMSNVSSKDVSTSIHFINILKREGGGHRFKNPRPKPAYGRQGLDWIIRPGYSFVVFSTNRGI